MPDEPAEKVGSKEVLHKKTTLRVGVLFVRLTLALRIIVLCLFPADII